jgi:hypothetical protein
MCKKKTHEQFIEEVYDLVGDEYTVLGTYIGSNKKIKIRHNSKACNNYEFDTFATSFVSEGTRCPICAIQVRKEKILKTKEQIQEQLNKKYNNEYIIVGNYIDTNHKVEIKHNKSDCGLIFEMTISNLLYHNHSCPMCSRKKISQANKKTNKQFIEEVKTRFDDKYLILTDYIDIFTKIQVKHIECGGIFEITPQNLLRMKKCPLCERNKPRKTNEEFKQEVYNLVESEYTVIGHYKNNRNKILMRHNICGKEFNIAPSNFLSGQRCPYCCKSKGETKIRNILTDEKIKFKEQFKFKDCRGEKRELPFDFAVFNNQDILICLIEYDGEQHYKPVKFYGCDDLQANLSHDKLIKNDKLKNDYCKRNKIQLLRIPYWEFDNIETILKENLGGIN